MNRTPTIGSSPQRMITGLYCGLLTCGHSPEKAVRAIAKAPSSERAWQWADRAVGRLGSGHCPCRRNDLAETLLVCQATCEGSCLPVLELQTDVSEWVRIEPGSDP